MYHEYVEKLKKYVWFIIIFISYISTQLPGMRQIYTSSVLHFINIFQPFLLDCFFIGLFLCLSNLLYLFLHQMHWVKICKQLIHIFPR